MTEDQIKYMANRFLGWHLPEPFRPDGGISFVQHYNNGTAEGGKHKPVGTNLFDADQAMAMVRYMADGLSIVGWALSEEQFDGVRDLIRNAYNQGCMDAHNNYQKDRDPDFTEAAYDYATSVTDAFLRLFPSVLASGGPEGVEPENDEMTEKQCVRISTSLAEMLVEYVEGGLHSGQNWRSGLSHIIAARLQRLWPMRDTVAYQSLPESDKQIVADLRARLSKPTPENVEPDHIADAGKMIPDGWQLVPIEPTPEILSEICEAVVIGVDEYGKGLHLEPEEAETAYRAALLSASPQPLQVK